MSPEFVAHLHKDTDVDQARIDKFVAAPTAVRLRVLAELRRRAGSDEFGTQLALMGVLVAIAVAVIPQSSGEPLPDLPMWVRIGSGLFTGIMLGVLFLPVVVILVVHTVRRDRAVVWLAAYEDALAEQHRHCSTGELTGLIRGLLRPHRK
jgi:hypothetical protein